MSEGKKPFWRKIPGFRTKTPWKMALASLFYLVILLILIGEFGGEKNQTTSTPSNQNQQTTSTSQNVNEPEQTFIWPSADVTKQNIKKALAEKASVNPTYEDTNFPKNINKIEIIDNTAKPGQKNVQIWFEPGMAWDETDFVKRIGGTAIIAGSIIFKNPKVEQLVLFAQTLMTDQYGNENLEIGTKIMLSRDTANKINWKGIADRHVTDPGNIYRIADNFEIHPGILKNVKLDEIRF